MTRPDAEPAIEVDDRRVGPRAVMFRARDVPLGGVRAMRVHRVLPQRGLPMIGAWCFLDRFGPQVVRMRVEPHPHMGLQTVTWPFAGVVRHRDAIGNDVVIARGQLNLMTSGAGIAHSEYSTGDDPVELDALQLWIALPDSRRHGAPAFERHTRLPEVVLLGRDGPDAYAVVVVGEFAGATSPATTFTPLAGAEVRVPPGARVRLPLHAGWEYGLVGIDGTLTVETDAGADAPAELTPQQLLYLGVGRDAVDVCSPRGATVFLLGGEPFDDAIVMWWNFVARTHEEIVAGRDAWERQDERFGCVTGHDDRRVPAPPLPSVRLTRRRRRL